MLETALSFIISAYMIGIVVQNESDPSRFLHDFMIDVTPLSEHSDRDHLQVPENIPRDKALVVTIRCWREGEYLIYFRYDNGSLSAGHPFHSQPTDGWTDQIWFIVEEPETGDLSVGIANTKKVKQVGAVAFSDF